MVDFPASYVSVQECNLEKTITTNLKERKLILEKQHTHFPLNSHAGRKSSF